MTQRSAYRGRAGRRRADRKQRIVLGMLLLAFYIGSIAALWAWPARTPWATSPADRPLSLQILVLAGATALAAIVLAVHYYGVAVGLRMILNEAWPALLASFGAALLTGFALRAAVPPHRFWLVLGPLYVCGAVVVVLFARRDGV